MDNETTTTVEENKPRWYRKPAAKIAGGLLAGGVLALVAVGAVKSGHKTTD